MPSTTLESAGTSRWLRILPIVILLYSIAFFDRVNIGMALPSMGADLHLNPAQKGFVGGIFFWGYLPGFLVGGWLALRLGPKRVILTCLLGWGFFSMATGFSRSLTDLAVLRFLLGLFEGPLWTSIALLLSQWFLKAERGRAFGIWNLSIPLGAALSGPLSGLVLQYADWHWMFLSGGLPAWIWAMVWWAVIPKTVDDAKWLPSGERQRLEAGIAAEHAELQAAKASPDWRSIFRNPAVWLLLGATCFNNTMFYGFGLWLPTMIKNASALNIGSVGVLNALPYVASAIGLVVCTQSSDRWRERRFHAGRADDRRRRSSLLRFARRMGRPADGSPDPGRVHHVHDASADLDAGDGHPALVIRHPGDCADRRRRQPDRRLCWDAAHRAAQPGDGQLPSRL